MKTQGSKLRTVHIITGLDQGGAEAMLANLVAALQSRCDTHVISLMDEGLHGRAIKQMGIPLHCLHMKRGLFSLQAFLRLRHIIKDISPDVVQTWMYHANLIGGIAARTAGCRNVAWGIHHSDLTPDRNKRSTLWVSNVCAILSRVVPRSIVSCSFRGMHLHRTRGYAAGKCVVIPNGFDTSRFRPAEEPQPPHVEAAPPARHARRVGNVARLDPQKDHRNLLQAFALILPDYADCRLILCGTGITGESKQLRGWLNETGLADNVDMLGPQQNIPDVLHTLDVFVLSSCGGEAFPLVLGEAMACGIPCVTTDVGDAAEIVGDTGWIVPPRNPRALANAIMEALAEAPAVRHERGRRCRRRIVENYEIAHVADMYYNLWTHGPVSEGRQ